MKSSVDRWNNPASSSTEQVTSEPKIPLFLPLWIFTNLLFTCVAEEAFFRQFVMEQILEKLGKGLWPSTATLIVSALFFAWHHLSGGLP